ncbi:MAG TPA: hypothetical protein VLQ45_13070 [Thermoanaerobaculia bacterium]|nr:hypothetical protein [Thermoanaerobaculia bacterium]
MSEKILVYGCGDVAWARCEGSPGSPFGEEWLTGRLKEPLPLEEGAAETVSLCDELDERTGWWPIREPPQVRVDIHRGEHVAAPVLPVWEDLAARQAGRITMELGGAGVLVTPQAWSASGIGRDFLRAWGRLGWRWASLEEALNRKIAGDARFVSAGSIWLRIHEPGGSAVVANGAEASCALEVTPRVLSRLMETVSPELRAQWLNQEEPVSGWFTRQQMVRRIAEALREGRRSIVLGGLKAPLFCFSSADAARRFSDLTALRITLDLPSLSAAIWWEQIADSGFLKSASGAAGRPALRWDALETILLGNPSADGHSSPREIRSLHTYLRFNGRPLRLLDPALLTEAREAAADLERCLARWDEAAAKVPPQAAKAPAETKAPAKAAKASPEVAKTPLKAPETPPETGKPAKTTTPEGEAAASPRDAGAARETASPVQVVSTVVVPPEAETLPDAAVEVADELPPDVDEPVIPMAADPLFDFSPDHLYLEQPHRRGLVKVLLDGVSVSPENVVPAQLAKDKWFFQLKGVTVPRGAIVRIDFEPE